MDDDALKTTAYQQKVTTLQQSKDEFKSGDNDHVDATMYRSLVGVLYINYIYLK